MFICQNAEGVHGQRKVENPWYRGSQKRPRALFEYFLRSWGCILMSHCRIKVFKKIYIYFKETVSDFVLCASGNLYVYVTLTNHLNLATIKCSID